MTRLSNPFFMLSIGLSLFGVLASAACHPGPVLPATKSNVGGTIAGIVSSVGNAPEPNRKVTATNVATGERFEATTGVNGGYTIQVPEGHYRLEVELRTGEVLTQQPGETHVQKSDLDPKRNFTITTKAPAFS
jgi:Carboxypeptidase regulatory-like domain